MTLLHCISNSTTAQIFTLDLETDGSLPEKIEEIRYNNAVIITKDSTGKTIVDFEGAVLPDGTKIEESLKKQFSNSLINVLREFGIVGVLTYLGGIVMLCLLTLQNEFNRQILFGVLGILLLSLASFISYFRIRVRRDREKFLIEMVGDSCNRLAEQLGKVKSNKINGIIQKIRQMQRDLILTIFNHVIEK